MKDKILQEYGNFAQSLPSHPAVSCPSFFKDGEQWRYPEAGGERRKEEIKSGWAVMSSIRLTSAWSGTTMRGRRKAAENYPFSR